MSEVAYNLGKVRPMGEEELESGLQLLLLYADKIPPHLAVLHQGRLYSLSAKDRQVGTKGEGVRKAIRTKRIPTLSVDLHFAPEEEREVGETLDRVFGESPPVSNERSVTCLTPVSKAFADRFGVKEGAVSVVFDLLDQLRALERIREYRHMYLFPAEETQKENYLRRYDRKEVMRRIGALEEERMETSGEGTSGTGKRGGAPPETRRNAHS